MGEDYEKIYSFESLYNAHKKARLGKQNKREVIEYEVYLTENLMRLQHKLIHKTYMIDGYRKFIIYYNATCRVGKGTHFAMDRLSGFMRKHYHVHKNDGYVLKCDIREYFNSISHEVLHKKIDRMKLDADVKWLLGVIIDSYEFENGRGIPMGNQVLYKIHG